MAVPEGNVSAMPRKDLCQEVKDRFKRGDISGDGTLDFRELRLG